MFHHSGYPASFPNPLSEQLVLQANLLNPRGKEEAKMQLLFFFSVLKLRLAQAPKGKGEIPISQLLTFAAVQAPRLEGF